jgi:hypothetical protein
VRHALLTFRDSPVDIARARLQNVSKSGGAERSGQESAGLQSLEGMDMPVNY